MLGRSPDILVNSAAIFERVAFESIDETALRRMIDVNLMGPFFLRPGGCAVACGAGGRGDIVNVLDIGGTQLAWKGYAHYCASKAGLAMLTRVLAVELAPEIWGERRFAPAPSSFPWTRPRRPAASRSPGCRKAGRERPKRSLARCVSWWAGRDMSRDKSSQWMAEGPPRVDLMHRHADPGISFPVSGRTGVRALQFRGSAAVRRGWRIIDGEHDPRGTPPPRGLRRPRRQLRPLARDSDGEGGRYDQDDD